MAVLRLEDPAKPAHPKGIYKALIMEREVKEGDFGPRFRWKLVTPKGELSYFTSAKYSAHPKANLMPFVKAVLGEAPMELDPDDLCGKHCTVFVEHVEKTNAVTGEKNTYDKVTKILGADDDIFSGE